MWRVCHVVFLSREFPSFFSKFLPKIWCTIYQYVIPIEYCWHGNGNSHINFFHSSDSICEWQLSILSKILLWWKVILSLKRNRPICYRSHLFLERFSYENLYTVMCAWSTNYYQYHENLSLIFVFILTRKLSNYYISKTYFQYHDVNICSNLEQHNGVASPQRGYF